MGQIVMTVHTVMTTCAAASCGPQAASPLLGVNPDVWALVSGLAAVAQLIAAIWALRATYRIAADQAAHTRFAEDQAEQSIYKERGRVAATEAARLRRFILAVDGVASAAAAACAQALKAIEPADTGNTWSTAGLAWNREMGEANEALEALRPVAPPDADLALILARLQATLRAKDLGGLFMFPGAQIRPILQSHEGAIQVERGSLKSWKAQHLAEKPGTKV